MDGWGRRGQNGGSGGSAHCQDDALGCWWEAFPPLCLFFRLALVCNVEAERLCGMQPGRHIGQDARDTQLVLLGCLGRLGRLGHVEVCPALEPYMSTLVRAKGEWGRNNLGGFDSNGLEEGQDVVTIVCDGGQRLGGGRIGGGLLLLTCLRLCFLGVNGDDAIVDIGLVCLAFGILVLCLLRDGAGDNVEELACVRLAVDYRSHV